MDTALSIRGVFLSFSGFHRLAIRLNSPAHMQGLLQRTAVFMSIDEILDNFAFLDDWEDRYRYLVELGRELEPLPEADRTDANKVQGCVSQVWLSTTAAGNGDTRLTFKGDSDAHIVRGLVAILISLCSGQTAQAILDTDIEDVFRRIGLEDNLTPQRANGLRAMIQRVRADAEKALAG